MEKDNNVYIKHMLDSISAIEKYIAGKDFLAFKTDSMISDAVIRQLEIIGEASGLISDEFRERHEDTPWRSIIGLRNKLIHDYFGIDLEKVWLITQKDLPVLKGALLKINQ